MTTIPMPPKKQAKVRVTINIDEDIVQAFKMLAKKECVAYQPLMNNALREFMNNYMPPEKK